MNSTELIFVKLDNGCFYKQSSQNPKDYAFYSMCSDKPDSWRVSAGVTNTDLFNTNRFALKG